MTRLIRAVSVFLLAASLLLACTGPTATSTPTPSPVPTPTLSPTATPTATATPPSTPIPAKKTSYENFKSIGLTPQTVPHSVRFSTAKGYADFSNRGLIDMFTATQTYDVNKPIDQATPSRFEFWRKQSDGSYVKDATLLPSSDGCIHPRKALVADFNNDGRMDVFVACHGYDAQPFPGEKNKIVLSQSNGIYSIQNASSDVGFFHGASAADLNGDGLIDVIVVNNFDPKTVFVLLSQGNGTFKREAGNRFPESIGGRNYFSVELVDVNEDSKLDGLVAGHEWENAPSVVLINPGDNDFSNVIPITLPAVAAEGVVLDFLLTGTGSNRTIWVSRTSGGDGTFYQSRVIQKVLWPSLTHSVELNQRPARWVPWIISAVVSGQNVITSDDARTGVLVQITAGTTISGTVTLQGRTATFPTGVGPSIARVALNPGGVTVSVNANGSFEIPGVAAGTYTLTASAAGYVSRERTNVVVGSTAVTLPSVQLRCGLVNNDNFVNINDITATVASFGRTLAARVDAQGRFVDQNGDGFVNINDITCVVSGFGTTSPESW